MTTQKNLSPSFLWNLIESANTAFPKVANNLTGFQHKPANAPRQFAEIALTLATTISGNVLETSIATNPRNGLQALCAKMWFDNTESSMSVELLMPFYEKNFVERAAHMPIIIVLQPNLQTIAHKEVNDYIESIIITLPQIDANGETPFRSLTSYVVGVFKDIANMLFITNTDGSIYKFYFPEVEMQIVCDVLSQNNLHFNALKTTHFKTRLAALRKVISK